MTATDRQLVTYEEAAQRLGVSVRTVQRRVRGGQLATVSDNGRQLVVLPGSPMEDGSQAPHNTNHDRAHDHTYEDDVARLMDSRMRDLEARVADLEGDRDHWRTMAAKLSDTVAEQNRMIAAQFLDRAHAEGRVLAAETVADMPAPAPATVAPPRRRWTLRALYEAWRGVR